MELSPQQEGSREAAEDETEEESSGSAAPARAPLLLAASSTTTAPATATSTSTDEDADDEPDEPRSPKALARVVDRKKLDASTAPTGYLRLELEPEWLVEGGDLFIDVPRLFSCAACDGGGCGKCDNTGAFPVDGASRAEPLRMSIAAGSPEGMRVRLQEPFGKRSSIGVLIVELRPGEDPSMGVRFESKRIRAMARAASESSFGATGVIVFVMAAAALVAILIIAMMKS